MGSVTAETLESIFTVTATELFSESQNLTLSTTETGIYATVHFLAYSSISLSITSIEGEREVFFSSSPPPVTQLNGVLTSYTLCCSPSTSSLPQSLSIQTTSKTVAGFSPNTGYTRSLAARNSNNLYSHHGYIGR